MKTSSETFVCVFVVFKSLLESASVQCCWSGCSDHWDCIFVHCNSNDDLCRWSRRCHLPKFFNFVASPKPLVVHDGHDQERPGLRINVQSPPAAHLIIIRGLIPRPRCRSRYHNSTSCHVSPQRTASPSRLPTSGLSSLLGRLRIHHIQSGNLCRHHYKSLFLCFSWCPSCRCHDVTSVSQIQATVEQ